jgi:hypothetical protein
MVAGLHELELAAAPNGGDVRLAGAECRSRSVKLNAYCAVITSP